MRGIFALALICLAAALLLPLLLAAPEGPAAAETAPEAEPGADAGIGFTALSGGELVETDMYSWLPGVVAGEMPASFEPEALKAQAVAARTYIMSRMSSGTASHPGAAVCDDPGCCKARLTDEELRENWGGAYEENMSKILSAVRSTDGQYLSYGGEAIEAVFHSSSAGKTEDSAELWSARPYLVSVDSPETAEDVPNYVTTVTVPCEDFAAKLSSLRPGADFSGEPALWLGPAAEDASGRVDSVEIGGAQFTGQELRELFSLRSTAFTLDYTVEGFLFTVTGFGHGVGMSQYGANVMAENGSGYREILAHYYPGTELAGA